MGVNWEILRSGPEHAEHGVLLLPGGACPARQYGPLMAEPALAGTRLVAATLPGHAGTPPPADLSVESYARLATELAVDNGCDVVVGFSMGATVALEMVASRAFKGPLVLLGISLSAADEPAFFRTIVRHGSVLGGLPIAALMKLTGVVGVRTAHASDAHKQEMRAALARNDALVLGAGMRAYLDYLDRHESPAERLCDAAVPTWVVHAEKGDGDLTDAERRTLETCPHVHMVTIPGSRFFLPDEEPGRVAAVVAEAVQTA